MRIANYFNTTKNEIDQRQYNILLGISLGNKYFTENNIREYLLWAIKNTRRKVVFLIPDKIHAINYEVKGGYSKERATKVLMRKSDELKNIIRGLIHEIPENHGRKCSILNWEDIEKEEYENQRKIIVEEFKKNIEFKNEILKITKDNVNGKSLEGEDLEKLASYVLNELPILISGIEYLDERYELLPYPGLSEIDNLVLDLQEGKRFNELSKKLNIKNKLRIIEAYAN